MREHSIYFIFSKIPHIASVYADAGVNNLLQLVSSVSKNPLL